MKELKFEKFKFENSNIETSYCEALILVTLVIEMQKSLKSIKLMKLSYIYGHVWTSKCWHINFWNPIFKDKLFVLKNVIYSCVNELKNSEVIKHNEIARHTDMDTYDNPQFENWKIFLEKNMFEECLSFILLNELKHVWKG